MALKKHRYKIEHNNFKEFRRAFDDCVRYSGATVLFIDSENDLAEIEITPKNPSMRKEALNLFVNRWKSCGFRITELAT